MATNPEEAAEQYSEVNTLLSEYQQELARLRAEVDALRDEAIAKRDLALEAAEEECARLRADVETGARLWHKELTQRLAAEQEISRLREEYEALVIASLTESVGRALLGKLKAAEQRAGELQRLYDESVEGGQRTAQFLHETEQEYDREVTELKQRVGEYETALLEIKVELLNKRESETQIRMVLAIAANALARAAPSPPVDVDIPTVFIEDAPSQGDTCAICGHVIHPDIGCACDTAIERERP